ncbi:uncharacterized protein LOC110467023 isoform X2 [Mizuhopecten yessoensis]|uniref:uncharacterized protein LOC110467023 isoform X2 n=1 Tax=Mizuhopecten yessoensis TaxID=6573 RepID=UPI000B4579B8|nr:uncharacterized protein LOC110467023 isoform X2 [Mizuhopecten yessoensis]
MSSGPSTLLSCHFRFLLRFSIAAVVIVSTSSFLACVVLYRGGIKRDLADNQLISPKFVIDTDGCKIPFIHPFDPSVIPFLVKSANIKCSHTVPSLTLQTLTKLTLNSAALPFYRNLSYCKYTPIVRPKTISKKYFTFQTDKSVSFQKESSINTDFIKVECFTKEDKSLYTNFHAFAVPQNSTKRRRRSTEETEDQAYNVLMLGIDSLSRNSFYRNLPKTRKTLLDKLGAVELLGYSKVGDNTFPNLIPITLGISVKELRRRGWNQTVPFDDYEFIWNKFSNNGYTTLFSEDMIDIGLFNYLKKGFKNAPVDHFYEPMGAATEAHPKLWSKKHCFGGRLETKIILDYVSDFLNVYKDTRTFGFAYLSRFYHNSDNIVKEYDDVLTDFLENFIRNDHAHNTVLIVFSDHGSRFGHLRKSPVGRLEERLPATYIVLPTNFTIDALEALSNLRENAWKLTTPFDIHETLMDILYQTQNRTINSTHGISLFSEIPPDRNCRRAGISNHWCTCSLFKDLDVASTIAKDLGQLMLKYVNKLLLKYEKFCSQLELKAIHYVAEWDITGRNSSATSNAVVKRDYVMKMETTPGGALLETTILYRNGKYYIRDYDGISRLNMYIGQADCITAYPAKKVCFCKSPKGIK